MRVAAILAFASMATWVMGQTPPYLSARVSLYGVGGVSSQLKESTGSPVSAFLNSYVSSGQASSSWGAAAVSAEATSPENPALPNQMQVSSTAQYWDLLTISNPALAGQPGTVTYRVQVEGSAVAQGGVDVGSGRVGDQSNYVRIALNYGEQAPQMRLFLYERWGDGSESGTDFTGQTLSITENFQFGQPMHLRLHLAAMAIGWADLPGHVRASLGNVQFLGIESVKDSAGTAVSFTASSLSGQPWGVPVPPFSFSLNKQTVAGQNYVQGTLTLVEPAAQNLTFTTTDNSSLVTTPPQVTISAGQTSKAFPIQVTAVNSTINVQIFARRGAVTRSCPLALAPLVPTALAFAPSPVIGGNSTSCRVVINGVAGPGGRTISVFDSSPYTSMPSTVTVPPGGTEVAFAIQTSAVPSVKTALVTAKVSAGGKSATLRIVP